MNTNVTINYAMAWRDLKTVLERGDITTDEQTVYVADLQKVMDELEGDARE